MCLRWSDHCHAAAEQQVEKAIVTFDNILPTPAMPYSRHAHKADRAHLNGIDKMTAQQSREE